jgi:hypothetical protein
MERWNRMAEKALRFAYPISRDIFVVHIAVEDEKEIGSAALGKVWTQYIERPAREASLKPPQLVVLRSPYRLVVTPIFEYILELEGSNPDRDVAVLVPELVERRWLHYLLHSQRATALKLILYRKGDRRTVVINVPWHVSD